MPYEWVTPSRPGARAELHVWPYRSLPKRGFVIFIGATALLVAVPLLSVLGSPVLWGILPFFLITITGIWLALRRSYADGAVIEELHLWPDRVTLTRQGPRGARHDWEANPYWVRVTLHQTGGPVENYVTLTGAGREVEIGAFLSEEERIALHAELVAAFRGPPS